jgi:transposase
LITLLVAGRLVGMYLRTTQRKNRDGTVVRYVQLAHNRRLEGVTQAKILLNLGREDQLDRDGLLRLVASINRYLGIPDAGPPVDAAGLAGDGLTVANSRPVGATHLLDGLWRALEIDTALRKVLGPRRFTTDMERVLFALVANRAIEPMSKLSAADWACCDVAIDGLDAMDEDQAYRAMDLLVEADAQAEVQEVVFFAVANLLNLEVDLLFFDTTSTYFERDSEETGDDAFRVYGHSKDHRDDLPQIVIGLAVTKESIPVRVWCWPGNTSDQAILPEVKDNMRGWRLGRVITVVDRGFSSADNLTYLRRAGGHFIAGMRMRDHNPLVERVLSRQGRYQQVKENLRVKEVRLDDTDVRFVICHNPEQADRDKTQRDDAVARLEAELERIKQARERNPKKAGTNAKAKAEVAHTKAECALRDHPTLGRWLRQSPSGRLSIDRVKIKQEERLDGKYLIATSDPHISAEDTALGYKNLLEAERGFRDMKSSLLLRPIFHRLEHRIRAHVLLCWLALLLVRVAERRAGITWRRIATELGRVHAVTLTGSAGTAVHTTPLTTTQAAILRDCQVTAPATVTALDPA